MKYGCNYSEELLELINEVPEICDYIKIGDFGITEKYLLKSYKFKPLLIHGFGWFERGGMSDLTCMNFKHMNTEINKYQSPFLGMHGMAYKKDKQMNQEIVEHMIKIFIEIREKLEVPLLIENMDYSEFYTYETTVKETVLPENISRVIEESDTYFLFDLSHARVSAYQLGIDLYHYIDRLPLSRLKEMHVSGSFYSKKEGFKDIHGIMNEDDFKVVEYIANHIKVQESQCLEVVTLEYGVAIEGQTDKEAIKNQLTRLHEIFET